MYAYCFTDPKYSENELVGLVPEVANGKLDGDSRTLSAFCGQRTSAEAPRFVDLFVQLNEREGASGRWATPSAFPLDDATLKSLTADLEARFQSKPNVSVALIPN